MQRKSTAGRNFGLLLGIVGSLLTFVAIAIAQAPHEIDITLDPVATTVHWTLGDVLHTVHGSFKLKKGAIHYDPLTGNATGLIEIDAASGESGSSARDQRMHKDVLESLRYQTITFRPTHVEGKFDQAAQGVFTVDGVFSLHGADHPMKMMVSAHPQSAGVELDTHFEVPYVQWGLKDPSTFVLRVNKAVSIDVESVAQVRP
ncbi:YceI family protein [Edaphobacter bradus]|uniref:YceI family protein n=1 Tax=Edaphobacter bradus TaxID=2259016 RepID=UPI0021DFD060|nr:YceI family protein [Edaphobacter bradus]